MVVSIVYMQTPWCRDIHSLFPVLLEEAGGTKDYEMSFPETFCFKLFFSSYVQMVLFFSSPPPAVQEAVPASYKMFLFSSSPKLPSHRCFFIAIGFHSGTVMEGKVE